MKILSLIKSLFRSTKKGLSENPDWRQFKKEHPRLTAFFRNRFDRTKFSGLPATFFGLAFFYVFFLFLGTVQNVLRTKVIVAVDIRISNLIDAFRSLSGVKFFLWVTLLSRAEIIICFLIVALALLALWRRREQIAPLLVAVAGSAAFAYLGKFVFHRARPEHAAYLEKSASFPSGHAAIAVAFYGFAAYLVSRRAKTKKVKILAVLSALIIAVAVGFSRIYLGVHYLSDVWSGYLVGALWLIIGISLSEWELFRKKHLPEQKTPAHLPVKIISAVLICLAVIFYGVRGFYYNPPLNQKIPAGTLTVASAADIFTGFNLPRYTETLNGTPQEPISFIVIAKSDEAFVKNFEKSGWRLADPVSFGTTLALAKSAVFNLPDPSAPMTPSFWNAYVHDFGFEKSTSAQSARERHHARFWKTGLQTGEGDPIYAGTASLDIGIKWLITHKISPDLDTERELLFADWQKSGAIIKSEKIKLVDPVLGKNFSGDQFFTDGNAYLVWMY